MVQNIRKRIGQTVIYGESRYMKRNGLEETGVDWRSEYGLRVVQNDWTNSDLRGVQIYEEEWTGWMKTMEASVSMGKRRME